MRSLIVIAVFLFALAGGRAAAEDADQPVEDESFELAPNGSFEDPAASAGSPPALWERFSLVLTNMTLTAADSRTGAQSILFQAQRAANAVQGLTCRRLARHDRTYTAAAYIMNNPKAPMAKSSRGVLFLEWRDEANACRRRDESLPWGPALSQSLWTRAALEHIAAPPGATHVVLGIQMSEDRTAGEGSFLVDDISLLLDPEEDPSPAETQDHEGS